MYYFSGNYNEIFLFQNTYGNCIEDYQVDTADKTLPYLREKAVLYNQDIAEANQKFYNILPAMDFYFKEHSDDSHKKLYETYRQQLLEVKDQDKIFFTFASQKPYYQDGQYMPINYIDVLNDFFDDFNTNYFEYYLMTQHLESINCCFLFTFRKLSSFVSRALNCKFFYCLFDTGVKAYIEDLNSLYLEYDDDGQGNISVTSDMIENNVNALKNYLIKRQNFINDTATLYNTIFKLLIQFIDFLVRLKVIIKVLSIVNIITNAHSDDNELFKEHISSIMELMGNSSPDTPATHARLYSFYIYVYQKDVIPDIIDLKIDIENKRKLTPKEKENLKKILILFSLNATGMVGKCQDLYSTLINYLSQYQTSKKEYFSDKSEDEIKKFEVNAYTGTNKLNPCYIIDYDNPPTPDEIKAIKDELESNT